MQVVWKYPLRVADEQSIQAPMAARPLAVQWQHGKLCLWMLVDVDTPAVDWTVTILGTGHTVDDTLDGETYVGTVQQADGALVWHVFAREA